MTKMDLTNDHKKQDSHRDNDKERRAAVRQRRPSSSKESRSKSEALFKKRPESCDSRQSATNQDDSLGATSHVHKDKTATRLPSDSKRFSFPKAGKTQHRSDRKKSSIAKHNLSLDADIEQRSETDKPTLPHSVNSEQRQETSEKQTLRKTQQFSASEDEHEVSLLLTSKEQSTKDLISTNSRIKDVFEIGTKGKVHQQADHLSSKQKPEYKSQNSCSHLSNRPSNNNRCSTYSKEDYRRHSVERLKDPGPKIDRTSDVLPRSVEVNGCRQKQSVCYQTDSGPNFKSRHDVPLSARRQKVIGFPFLRGLIGKDPGHIITELSSSSHALIDCITRAANDKQLLEIVLQVISEAYQSQSTPNLLSRLFETLKQSNIFQYLMAYLVNNVIARVQDEDTIDDKRLGFVLKHALVIITKQISRNPSSIFIFLGLHAIISQVFEKYIDVFDDDIKALFEHINEEAKTASQQGRKAIAEKAKSEKRPPDDFRQYPISPKLNEILGTTKPFLRPNRIDCGYENLHDYLDVQFRLLREDFVGPLRESMTDFINMIEDQKENPRMKPNLRNLEIKVYENVTVAAPVVTQYGLGFKMKLEMNKRLKTTDWKFSKRLIFGSLVCLTDNNFKDFVCATVVERDEKDIRRGFFVVRFEEDGLTAHNLFHKVFRMAETTGYFESYRHVLLSLQSFQDGDLPFEKYIIACEKQVDPPKYLLKSTRYDLRPLVDRNVQLQPERRPGLATVDSLVRSQTTTNFSTTSFCARNIRVSDRKSWPPKELLHMDESQYRAVQTALTNEFAVIQGPPGTGKTYIGLQIVKVLLHNKTAWANPRTGNTPMLIVCYTNHALDQFLEGIVKFFKGDIVRVGGRSVSKDLKKYNIKSYRRESHAARSLLGRLQRTRKTAFSTLKLLSIRTLRLSKKIEIYKSAILAEEVLEPVMGHLLDSLYNDYRGNIRKKGFSYICCWLGINKLQDRCLQQSQIENIVHESERIEVEADASRRVQEAFIDGSEFDVKKQERLVENTIIERETAFYISEFPIMRDSDESKVRKSMFQRRMKTALVKKITNTDIMSDMEAKSVRNVWRLNEKNRWKLYRLWIKNLCSKVYDEIEERRGEFEAASEQYQEAQKQEDKEIMRQAAVIGMTTSCAARYQTVLRDISPKIVVVEEAAEVFEAHIITTLSKGCEHLILIGDHKQLRPNPSVYKLAIKYNLDISLFERMVKNGISFECLELQHRMRPEISSIMRHIYPNLQDHEHVKTYPNIKGVSTNMFFIDHKHLETSDEGSRSFSNTKEAEYAVALCRYMRLQGYKNTEITLLTTYTGQLRYLQKLMPKAEFDGIKVTVVDNYQGEENNIVILSLVRSNTLDKIGFLSIENRICVALSRAKLGFFMIGNFEHLASHSSLWKNITDEMKKSGKFGEGLQLYCQNHPTDSAIIAKTARDFNQAPEGGCMKLCDVRLNCGHKCTKHCHILDPDHTTNKCVKKCRKVLCEIGHTCPDLCYINCRPCKVPVLKTIPKCGHKQHVPCATDPDEFICRMPCAKRLQCGHACRNTCGEEHTKTCIERVPFKCKFGHRLNTICHTLGMTKCLEPCKNILKCDHLCSGTCSTCFEGKIHRQCTKSCKRILICGHECRSVCNNCPPCTRPCQNRCVHSKCIKRCGEPCQPCGEKCDWRCDHYKCTNLCSEPCNRPKCNEPCKKRLKKCNHACIGLCGEPCPTLCRTCDKTVVTTIFFGDEDTQSARFVLLEDCNHIFESKAMDKYMEMDISESTIQLKVCPLCKTPIRKCLRYGDIINHRLQDIERVKKTIIGDPESMYKALETKIATITKNADPVRNRIFRGLAGNMHKEGNVYKTLQIKLMSILYDLHQRGFYSEAELITLENQIRLSIGIADIISKLESMHEQSKEPVSVGHICAFFEDVLNNIVQQKPYLSEQEIEDYVAEIQRGNMCYRYLRLKQAIRNCRKSVETAADLNEVSNLLFGDEKLSSESRKKAEIGLNRLQEHAVVDGLGITEDERLEIVKAVGLSKGHWFKCPNNHIYAIGECGGANEKSTCPECKAEIGGLHHRLTDGNKLAQEMDGATFAAYSEEANNMANFDLNNLH